MTAVGFERAESQGSAARLLFERGSRKHRKFSTIDEEKALAVKNASQPASATEGEIKEWAKQSIFTFKDINYFVQYQGSEKQLLQKVSGFVKPGQLVALMGTSGAGKTTYVSVLHQHQRPRPYFIQVDGRACSAQRQRKS